MEEAPDLAAGDPDSENILIQGDNLQALKALLPFYAGSVKCIYIDPPYNTGSAFENYDDYSQTRSRQEAGLLHFGGKEREETTMPGIKMKRRKAKENRAAIYARVSDQSQDAEDKTSITEQTSEMEAHCERRGLTIVARYQEVGQGWSKKRPEFQRMLADARRGRFDTIVCWKSDRLSRGMYPAAALMEVVEAEVVRRIYRMCVNDGLGGRVIGQRLMADGVPAANQAKRWWDGQVYRILSNETYKGTWWYGKARYISTEDGIRVHEKDKDTWIPVPFPEIVDEKTWDLAQSVMKKRRTQSGRNTKIFYLLQHLVRCTGCGMLMGCMATRKRTVKRNGRVYKYAERLEGLIWGEVKKVMENPDIIVAGIESLESQEGEGSWQPADRRLESHSANAGHARRGRGMPRIIMESR